MDIGPERIEFTPAEIELGGLDQSVYDISCRTDVAGTLRKRLGGLLRHAGGEQEALRRDSSEQVEGEGWAERVAEARTHQYKVGLLADMIERLDPRPPIDQ